MEFASSVQKIIASQFSNEFDASANEGHDHAAVAYFRICAAECKRCPRSSCRTLRYTEMQRVERKKVIVGWSQRHHPLSHSSDHDERCTAKVPDETVKIDVK